MNDRGRRSDTEPPAVPRTLRRLAIGITVPLAAAAVLWWAAGSDVALARWISLGVVLVALGGWYLSKDRSSDG